MNEFSRELIEFADEFRTTNSKVRKEQMMQRIPTVLISAAIAIDELECQADRLSETLKKCKEYLEQEERP